MALFGYFFGPRFRDVPTLKDAASLRPTDAIQRLQFGDLDLLNGDWPVLGSLSGWDRQQWPMPNFAHRDALSGRPYIRTFDENSMKFLTERTAQEEEIVGLPESASFGAGAVMRRLSRVIREREQAQQSRPPTETLPALVAMASKSR